MQTSQPWTLPPPWQDDSGIDPSAAESSTVEPDQVRRKAILRSKSDVGPSRFAPDLLPAVPPEFSGDVPLDLDAFFDTIGQHGKSSCPNMMINTSGRSSPVYFSSVSSVDSYCKRRHVDNIYESSDSEDMAATLQRRLLGNVPPFKAKLEIIYSSIFFVFPINQEVNQEWESHLSWNAMLESLNG